MKGGLVKILRIKGFIYVFTVLLTFSGLLRAAEQKSPVPASAVLSQIDPQVLEGLKPRAIGPAGMSGRIGAIDAVIRDPRILYVGAASGGVWKSEDQGLTWKPVFDDQPVASVGAITINQSCPDIVWVGTGEAAPRNSVSIGRGVYLTRDAGKTWTFVGLEKTEKISKILLHPADPEIAFVGALGATWGDSLDRGVFKTTDGGKTWKKVLFVDERTGVADLAMDPGNPNRIIAAMWEHRRWPWFFKSGGPGSGLYLTTDGGENWQRLTDKNGLPKGELGRIGIAFAPCRREVVYALVEAEKNVLLRSEDGGINWQVVNIEQDINNRPFYYCRLWVNPVNENILYLLASQIRVSEDGGKTLRTLAEFNQSHSDYHAMWIHPAGEMMIVGNDGGVVISYNRGRSWRFMENLPLGQFYHISYDLRTPYYVYGGLQDNGSWCGPAYTLIERRLYNYHWTSVGGGDGFDTEPDPENPGTGYGMSQGGNLYYFDTTTGTSRTIVPTESDVKHRYNWNAGFAVDPFHPATIYLGSQFVHRSKDKGRTWEIISSDLTTNDPEKQKQSESGGLTLDVTNAENHCSILCIVPSTLQEGLIWVGTDDGNVQLTRNGGKTWELVSGNLTAGKKPLLPAGCCAVHIEASKHDVAKAFIVFDDHQRSNFTPYVFVTSDFGKTWKSLVTAEIDGHCKVIEEDPVNANLLFLGTEFGMFVSVDGGGSWMKWSNGLPSVPVFDLAVHPRENDLIIGTHGRSIYIIDDITPLRELTPEIAKRKLRLFSIQEAYQFQQGRMSSYLSPGDTAFSADNKSLGACFTYYLTPVERKAELRKPEGSGETTKSGQAQPPAPETSGRTRMSGAPGQMGSEGFQRTSSRVAVSILDSEGNVIYQTNGQENKGINRVFWNLMEQEPRDEEERSEQRSFFFGRRGVMVLPGEYKVRIRYDNEEVSQIFEVKPDPRFDVDPEVLKANYNLAKEAQKLSAFIRDAQSQIRETQKALQTVREYGRTNLTQKFPEIMSSAEELEEKLNKLSETLNPTPPKQGIADRSASLTYQVRMAVMGITRSGYEPVSQAAQVRYEKAKAKVEIFLEDYNNFFQKDVEEFKKILKEAGFTLFKEAEELRI